MPHIPLPDCQTLRNETARYLCERVKYLEQKKDFTIFCVGTASVVVALIALYLSYKAKAKAKDRKGFRWIVAFKTLVLVFGSFKGMVAIVDEDITLGLLTDGDQKVSKLDKAEDVPSTKFNALFRYGVPDEGRPEISKNGSVVDGSPNTNTNREWKIDLGRAKY